MINFKLGWKFTWWWKCMKFIWSKSSKKNSLTADVEEVEANLQEQFNELASNLFLLQILPSHLNSPHLHERNIANLPKNWTSCLFVEVDELLVRKLERLNCLQHGVPVAIVDVGDKTVDGVNRVERDAAFFLRVSRSINRSDQIIYYVWLVWNIT